MYELPSVIDNLAINGIVDFDAEAYVKGSKPRYIGRPHEPYYAPFDRPLPAYPEYPQQLAPELHAQPKHDEFAKPGNPSWKKQLATALILGLGVYTGYKQKNRIISLYDKNLAPKIAKYIVDPFKTHVLSKFKTI